jgi:hypothetical protein
MTTEPLRQLPITVKLRPGEHPEAFIRRLATANHLRPSYLRFYLTNPPRQLGSVDPGRLARLTGRSVEDLLHVMPTLHPARNRAGRQARRWPTRHDPASDTTDLTTRLHRAASTDETVLRLFRQFAVPRPTVIAALTGHPPPAAHGDRTGRHSPKLRPIASRLDDLIAAHPDASTTSICCKIRQEDQVTVCDAVIRDYINHARARPGDPKSIKYLVSRPELFAAIRHHAAEYDLVAALADQFSAAQDVVRRALTSYVPSPPGRRKTLHNPSLEPVRDHIAAMITAEPAVTATAIWERLVDHHDIDISYATIRDYVAREHRRPHTRTRVLTHTR